MKVFIVFLALFTVGISFVSYQGDMSRYVYMQTVLKEACEECAAGAALCLEEEEYGDGRLVFDREEGLRYAEKYTAHIVQGSLGDSVKSAECTLRFKDDETNDFAAGDAEYSSAYPTVSAEIRLETEDLFGLPFLTVTELARSACYELKTL